MEQWQRDYVTANLTDLLKNTVCNTNLLAIFKSKGVLSVSDLDTLDAIRNSRGRQAQVYELFNILPTRVGAYKITVEAFHETGQTGARNLLAYGYMLIGSIPAFDFADELFDWDSDHFSLYDEILSKVVNAHGRKKLISEICHNINQKKLREIMKRTIDKNCMLKLLSNKCDYVLIRNTIPDKIDYYIQRTLTSRTRLRVNILKENMHDVFVVKDVSLNQLAKLASPHVVDRSSNQLENITVRHIICETDEDFHSICEISPEGQNVHLLSFENDKMYWITSHGSITSFHSYIHENQEAFNEKVLIEQLLEESNLRRPVCISDTPGMGKTILLANIANRINISENDTIIFFFVLREFVQHLPKHLRDITAEKIKELISSQVTETDFGRGVVQNLLSCQNQKVDICFDGFDEVLDSQIEATEKLLRIISCEFSGKTRVLVTTRPHMRQQLERTLNVLSFNILPFDQSNQVEFLVNYWQFQEQKLISKTTVLETFANCCLKTLKEKMVDDQFEIAGVPLQCRLLGEIYQKHANRMLSASSLDDVPLVDSIFKMYQNLMYLRFERAKEQQKVRDSSNMGTGKLIRLFSNRKSWIKKVKEIHFLIALDLIFPDFTNIAKMVLPFDQNKYLSRRELYRLGLIEEKATFNKNYRFTHRTFAEFLVAEFLANVMISGYQIKKKPKFWHVFLDFLFHHVLKTQKQTDFICQEQFPGIKTHIDIYNFENSVISYFLNAHLKDKVINSWNLLDMYQYLLDKKIKYCDLVFHNIFIACAFYNFQYLYNIFMILFKAKNQHALELPAELLVAAAKYSGIRINDDLYSVLEMGNQVYFSSGSDKDNLVTPIQTAVVCGNHAVVQVILNKHKKSCLSKNLLHFCLAGSHFDSFEIIGKKLEIIKLLLEHAPQLCNERLSNDDATPILQTDVNVELIQCLLESGTDVNAFSRRNENVLHKFLQKYGIQENELVDFVFLLKKHNFTEWNKVNLNGETPVFSAVETILISSETLNLFHSLGTDFAYRNMVNENLLHIAIRHKQPADCLEQLIKYGVDVTAVNSNLETLLHIAAEVGHLQAVEILLKCKNNLKNRQDFKGNTPLHDACARDTALHLQIQDLLIQNGSMLNILNCDGCTPVEFGLQRIKNLVITVERLEKFQKMGHTISKSNADKLVRALILNENAVNWDSESKLVDLLHFLFSIGGRVKLDNKRDPESVNSLKACIAEIAEDLYRKYASEFPSCVNSENPETVFLNVYNYVLRGNNKIQHEKLHLQEFTLESVIFLLFCLKEKRLFRKLQIVYQFVQSNSNRFVSTFAELVEFVEGEDRNLCVIFSDDVVFSVAKIQDTIDPSILVVDMIVYENVYFTNNNAVVVIVSQLDLTTFLLNQRNSNRKIICVTLFSSGTINIPLEIRKLIVGFRHQHKWNAFSPMFQNQLLRQYKLKMEKHQTNIFQFDLKSLELSDILTPDVITLYFLIPNYVSCHLNGFFDLHEIWSLSKNKKLQQYALKLLFPHYQFSTVSTDETTSETFKQLSLHGPTASLFVAMWILNNLNEIATSHESFYNQIFSSYSIKVVINGSMNNIKKKVKSYEFHHWLILYYLEKLATLHPTEQSLPVKTFLYKSLLHCCINLHAPNLLKLFDHQFCLSNDTLLLSVHRGNFHLFYPINDNNTGSKARALDSSFLAAAFSLAVEKMYFSDITYYLANCEKLVGANIVQLFTDNSSNDNTELVKRKQSLFDHLFKKGFISKESIRLSLRIVIKCHPEMIKYLIALGAKPNLVFEVLSTYLTNFQFFDLLEFLLTNEHVDALLATNKSNVTFAQKLLSSEEKINALNPNCQNKLKSLLLKYGER